MLSLVFKRIITTEEWQVDKNYSIVKAPVKLSKKI